MLTSPRRHRGGLFGGISKRRASRHSGSSRAPLPGTVAQEVGALSARHHLYFSIDVVAGNSPAAQVTDGPSAARPHSSSADGGSGFGGGSVGPEVVGAQVPGGGVHASATTPSSPVVAGPNPPNTPTADEVASIRAEVEECVASSHLGDAILLLVLLESARCHRSECSAASSRRTGEETLRGMIASPRLSAKLSLQLSDWLTVVSGALPKWLRALLHRCPALFAHPARLQYCRSSAFGSSRAMQWLHEEEVTEMHSAYTREKVVLEAAAATAMRAGDEASVTRVRLVSSEIDEEMDRWRARSGGLKSTLAKVQRSELLVMAERLMARQVDARSRNTLEVQFEGESGFGSGVTQNFYSSIADELLKAPVHAALPLWVTSAGAVSTASGVVEYVSHGGELFPLPLPPAATHAQVAAVCGRFHFLGRLMAAACRDGFIVPLPLSRHFFHLVRGGKLSHAALPPPSAPGGAISAYAAVATKLEVATAAHSCGRIGLEELVRLFEQEGEWP